MSPRQSDSHPWKVAGEKIKRERIARQVAGILSDRERRYAARVRQYERKGMTTSDAQGCADADQLMGEI